MRSNHSIDFFSSPAKCFMGLIDLHNLHNDINNHDNNNIHEIDQIVEDQHDHLQEENYPQRKSSFNDILKPIVPFQPDFFDQKLQECDKVESYLEKYDYSIPFSAVEMQITRTTEKLLFAGKEKMQIERNKIKIEQIEDERHQSNTIHKKTEEIKIQAKKQDSMFMTPVRKSQFSNLNRFNETTSEKPTSRANEKGLRKLSNLAYSIVNNSSATTYKQVAQKLLNHLNPDQIQMEESPKEKNSMQNVKRRVYDSLNVLLALGVIKRVGNKITKQKQKKGFLSTQAPDVERFNELIDEYNKKLLNIEAKKKTELELRQKLMTYKRTIERNKTMKGLSKNKMIRLPFLAFASQTDCDTTSDQLEEQIKWVSKNFVHEKQRKKVSSKRHSPSQEITRNREQTVQIFFKGNPESYGDLDFFKLIQQDTNCSINNYNFEVKQEDDSYSHEQEQNRFMYPMDGQVKEQMIQQQDGNNHFGRRQVQNERMNTKYIDDMFEYQ